MSKDRDGGARIEAEDGTVLATINPGATRWTVPGGISAVRLRFTPAEGGQSAETKPAYGYGGGTTRAADAGAGSVDFNSETWGVGAAGGTGTSR